ncbi:MAG: hypothetical protein ACKOGA_23990 [Planctomycetaceae bacterium]
MRIHSWTSTKCEVADSSRHGTGVCCVAPMAAGEVVMIWGGKVYSSA